MVELNFQHTLYLLLHRHFLDKKHSKDAFPLPIDTVD